MKWSLERKWIAGCFGLTLMLMGVVSFASFKNTIEIRESANQVQQTYETLNTLTDFYAAMTVAESGRRGYVFLGSEQELERYQTAIENMQSAMKLLQKQVSNIPNQQQKILQFNLLVNQRIALLQESIILYQQDKNASQTQNFITERSIKIRGRILQAMADIRAKEEIHLQNLLSQSEYSIQTRTLIEIWGTFLSLIVISCLFYILYRQWIKRSKLETLERSLAQEKEMGELKLRLFSMISHEFRTPLSVILLSSQLLRETLEELVEKKQLKNLYRIQSSAKLMNHLLTDILTLTRAEAGKLEYKPQLINVEDFCLNLVEDLQLSGTNSITVKFVNNGHCHRANLDEKLLYSILSNLLLNAIKYSPGREEIDLILNCEPSATVFQVKDKGIGIAQEDIQKIYEPFYRGKNVDNLVGSGLGLAVVKKCLELHQGEISVTSEIDVGTTFTVKIPTKSSQKNILNFNLRQP